MAAKKVKGSEEAISVSPPRFAVLTQRIVGTAPYVQARFPEKARHMMKAKHEAGSTAKKGKTREARDFGEDYLESMYCGANGERGIPAAAFRAAFISACRTVNFKMTLAKMGLFVRADAVDPRDGTGLVVIEAGFLPVSTIMPVRNATGVVDLRARAMWKEWAATLRVQFDTDMFRLEDVVNLVARAGAQVGVGEGRADSKKSAGMGWGFYRLDGAGSVEYLNIIDAA